MAFSVKDWQDTPSTASPIDATSLEDMETRLSGYTDSSITTFKGHLSYNIADYAVSSDPDDTLSFTRAAAAMSAGGTLELGPRTYLCNANASITWPAKTRLVGRGDATKIKVNNAVSTQTALFNWTDLTVESMVIQGPDSPATTGLLALLQGLPSNTNLRLRDVTLSYAQWLIKSYNDATALKVQATRCKFLGDGLATAALGAAAMSMGIHIPADGVAELILDDCDFDNLGSQTAAPNLNHAIYVYQPTSLNVHKCRFTNHWNGRYIQSFGGSGTARYWNVDSCYFGAQNVANVACHTSLGGVTSRYDKCTFEVNQPGIQLKGDAVISRCTFTGSYGAGYQIGNYDTTALEARIDKCTFTGTNNADIDINTAGAVDVDVTRCRFKGGSTRHFRVTASSTAVVKVANDNVFTGAAAAPAVHLDDCARATVSDNRFKIGGTGRSVQTGGALAPTVLDLHRNEFSQNGGQSVHFPTLPPTFNVDGNYGTKGYVSRNGAVASKLNGSTIAHGLGAPGGTNAAITPTKYGVTSAVAGHIAGVSAVDATNLTITLTDSAGTNIVVNENVIWWAEK